MGTTGWRTGWWCRDHPDDAHDASGWLPKSGPLIQEELDAFLTQLKEGHYKEIAEPRSVCDLKVLKTHFCRPESSFINELYKKYKEETKNESDFMQSINAYVNHNHFYNLHSIIPERNVNNEVMRFTQSLNCPVVYKSLLENDQEIIEKDKKRIMNG